MSRLEQDDYHTLENRDCAGSALAGLDGGVMYDAWGLVIRLVKDPVKTVTWMAVAG